ncbi:hypothetical protein THAOC_28455, partial [Thalassiosira oceanica]
GLVILGTSSPDDGEAAADPVEGIDPDEHPRDLRVARLVVEPDEILQIVIRVHSATAAADLSGGAEGGGQGGGGQGRDEGSLD